VTTLSNNLNTENKLGKVIIALKKSELLHKFLKESKATKALGKEH
jgi:hypothetical protein